MCDHNNRIDLIFQGKCKKIKTIKETRFVLKRILNAVTLLSSTLYEHFCSLWVNCNYIRLVINYIKFQINAYI